MQRLCRSPHAPQRPCRRGTTNPILSDALTLFAVPLEAAGHEAALLASALLLREETARIHVVVPRLGAVVFLQNHHVPAVDEAGWSVLELACPVGHGNLIESIAERVECLVCNVD